MRALRSAGIKKKQQTLFTERKPVTVYTAAITSHATQAPLSQHNDMW